MDGVVLSLPLTEVERRVLAMLGSLRPHEDGGLSVRLLAARVQTLRDGGGLGQDWGGDIARGLTTADDVLCLLLASLPASGPDALIERSRLFSRHRGRTDGRLALFTAGALEADRRRLGMLRSELV